MRDDRWNGWDDAQRDDMLPDWAREQMATPLPSSMPARAAIMACIRRESAAGRAPAHRRLSAPVRPSRWIRRGLLTPFGTMAVASVMALVVSMRALGVHGYGSGADAFTTSATVLRDTIVSDGTVRDTLRIVQFMLRGPFVQRAVVVGDFNTWRRGATALQRGPDGSWYGQALVPRDAVRFAYIVNDAPPSAPWATGALRRHDTASPGTPSERDSI